MHYSKVWCGLYIIINVIITIIRKHYLGDHHEVHSFWQPKGLRHRLFQSPGSVENDCEQLGIFQRATCAFFSLRKCPDRAAATNPRYGLN
jgi:hypothetical protein